MLSTLTNVSPRNALMDASVRDALTVIEKMFDTPFLLYNEAGECLSSPIDSPLGDEGWQLELFRGGQWRATGNRERGRCGLYFRLAAERDMR